VAGLLWARRFGGLLPLDGRLRKIWNFRSLQSFNSYSLSGVFIMRNQRGTAVPAPARAAKAAVAPLTAGYGLVVDGQLKAEFETRDRALKAAKDLKTRFPMLQIKVIGTEHDRSEEIVSAVAEISRPNVTISLAGGARGFRTGIGTIGGPRRRTDASGP
jgi:hypothetical protein